MCVYICSKPYWGWDMHVLILLVLYWQAAVQAMLLTLPATISGHCQLPLPWARPLLEYHTLTYLRDNAMWCRGAVALEVEGATAIADAHSGICGGSTADSAHALVMLLASLRHDNGGIAVEGFDDNARKDTAVGEMKDIH
jgi:hypothetical protein